MAKIKCPKCGEVFSVDEKEYADILMQIKNEEFNKELEAREKLLKEQNKNSEELLREQLNNKYNEELNAAELRYNELKNQKEKLETEYKHNLESLRQQLEIDNQKDNAQLASEVSELKIKLQAKQEELEKQKVENQKIVDTKVALVNAKNESEKAKAEAAYEQTIARYKEKLQEAETNLRIEKNDKQHSIDSAIQEKVNEITKLKADIQLKDKEFALEKNNLEQRHKDELKLMQGEVDYYKDLKAKTSVKLLGESLEQHCLMSFNQVRMNSYPRATFVKDNDVVEGTKGDFVFRDFTEDGAELISIMFEMKNESDVSTTKHKNEDFYKKLDEDRKKKNCEYAVLVSMLEPDNDYFNTGIVDVSYEYPKMFVIRPQFFIPFIGLLYNAAKTNANEKNELLKIRNQNLDISNFEEKLYEFQDKFGKNYLSAKANFEKAIEEIDKTINHLNKVKEGLLTADNQLRLANDKAQDLTIRKLTFNNPTMKQKFEEVRKEKQSKSQIKKEHEEAIEINVDIKSEQALDKEPEIEELEKKTNTIAKEVMTRQLKACRLKLFQDRVFNIMAVLTDDKIAEIVEKNPTTTYEVKEILNFETDNYVCQSILQCLKK